MSPTPSMTDPSFNPFRYTKFHRALLDPESVRLYDSVREAFMDSKRSISLGQDMPRSTDYYHGILTGVLNDNPFIFWTTERFNLSMDKNGYRLNFIYNSYNQSKELVKNRLVEKLVWIRDNVVCGVTDETELSFLLHDYLTSSVKYCKDDPVDHHTLIGPLLLNRGACDSISDSYSLLMNAFGVRCTVVHGHTTDDSDTGHAWNISVIDGKAYHTDVTFDLEGGHRYLNNSDAMISSDHIYRIRFKADSLDSNWYIRNGCHFTKESELRSFLKANSKAKTFEFYYESGIDDHIIELIRKNVKSGFHYTLHPD